MEGMEEEPRFLTVEKAATLCVVTPAAIRNAIYRDKLKAKHFYGRWLILPEDLEVYRQNLKIGRSPDPCRMASSISARGTAAAIALLGEADGTVLREGNSLLHTSVLANVTWLESGQLADDCLLAWQ